MNTALMFSSETDLWATPQDFFDRLDDEFHFTLDPCATPENAKCDKYFTVKEDGLKQDWQWHRWNEADLRGIGGIAGDVCIERKCCEERRF